MDNFIKKRTELFILSSLKRCGVYYPMTRLTNEYLGKSFDNIIRCEIKDMSLPLDVLVAGNADATVKVLDDGHQRSVKEMTTSSHDKAFIFLMSAYFHGSDDAYREFTILKNRYLEHVAAIRSKYIIEGFYDALRIANVFDEYLDEYWIFHHFCQPMEAESKQELIAFNKRKLTEMIKELNITSASHLKHNFIRDEFSFNWSRSKRGLDYWSDIYYRFMRLQ